MFMLLANCKRIAIDPEFNNSTILQQGRYSEVRFGDVQAGFVNAKALN
jgi:hypothetical protein